MNNKKITLRDLSMEFAVGAFFFLALILLAFFTIILNRDSLISSKVFREIEFSDVSGLAEGDAVLARGVQVGSVDQLRLHDDNVVVTVALGRPIEIHEDYQAEIRFSSILGGRYVALDPGTKQSGEIDDEQTLTGKPPADLMADAADIMKTMSEEVLKLRQTLNEGGLLKNLSESAENINAISTDIRAGRGTLGMLVKDASLYNDARNAATDLAKAGAALEATGKKVNDTIDELRAGRGTLGRLMTDSSLYDNAAEITANLKNGQGTLGKMLADDKIYNELEATMGNLKELTHKLNSGDSSLARLMADDGALFKQLLEGVNAATEVVKKVRDGQGTLGKLTTDDTLYKEAERVVAELRAAIEDLREQTPISTFGSFAFGAL